MTSIRTMWGIDLQKVEQEFGYDYARHISKESQIFLTNEELEFIENNIIRATPKGKLMADHIASELFFLHDNHKS